jgi:hypothetical protein
MRSTMTVRVVWGTDTLTLQPAIAHAVARRNAPLVIVSERTAMPTAPIDRLIWSPTRVDRARYAQIRPRCLHMVTRRDFGKQFHAERGTASYCCTYQPAAERQAVGRAHQRWSQEEDVWYHSSD